MADAYVQAHIHLAATLEASGEKAPIYQWTTTAREQVVVFDVNVRRSLSGVPFAHVVQKQGVPVLHFDYIYSIRLEGDADLGLPGTNTVWDYQDRLIALAARPIYLVDHRHCVDGLDHTPFVRPVMITKIGNLKDEHPLLRYFYAQVYLNDLTMPA